MLARRLLSLMLLPALLAACPEKDDPDTSAADSSSSADSSGSGATTTTTDPTTGAEDSTGQATTAAGCVQFDCSEMCAKNHDEPCHTPYSGSCVDDVCVCEAQPDDCEPPLEVECGMETCAVGQICLQPGRNCDYGQDPPEYYKPAPECKNVPSNCDDKTDDALTDCLGTQFCPAHDADFTEYMNGRLECPSEAPDCF